jgi:D-inositol-3-phosphate glycosyltransferase
VKIAIVGPAHPYKGGPAQHATSLAHRLAAAGHEVTLESWIAQYPKLLYPGQLTVDQPEVALFGDTRRSLAWYRPDSWWRTGRRLARGRYDAVILFLYTPVQVPAYVVLSAAARRGGCTMVALCNNVLPHERRGVDRALMGFLLRRMRGLVVHSKEQAELAATLTSAPAQVATLPPHLPHGQHPPAPPAAGDAAAEQAGPSQPAASRPDAASPAGPDPDRPAARRLLFFGIVRPYKGLDVLLRALPQVSAEVTLTVAGEIWGDRAELDKLISDLGLADRVSLSGGYVATEDVPALFAGADALVLPYRSGTASQNAMIAFDFGIPVIATRAGAIADAVADGVNGILCAPDDVAGLAQAISRLYQPGVLQQLRRGVRPVYPDALWNDYVAAAELAISGGK